MVLRKHILGLRIKNVYTIDLERVIFIELEGFDAIDDIINIKLVIELMGKHSNIILLDDNNIIIDSLRHIKDVDNNYRNILPHCKYAFPSSDKTNFYDIKNFAEFQNLITETEINNLPSFISKSFNGFSKPFIEDAIQNIEISDCSENSLKALYNYISKLLNNIEKLELKVISSKKYVIEINENKTPLSLNFAIDNFYTEKENANNFKIYRDSVLKFILATLKKYNKRLYNIANKLKECDNMEIYQLYGELLTANLYKIENKNIDKIELENYYDNNNLISIPLDKKYSPSVNAKRYFKKYNKLKNALEVVSKQKKETLRDLDYIESVVFELENCQTLEDVDAIYEEISEHDIFKNQLPKTNKKMKVKKSQLTRNKTVSFNPIKYTVDDHTILVGRNNKENDYLTLKFASKTDYWFHTKDIHGSHVILKLKTPDEIPSEQILTKSAELAAYYSKARNSSNVPVDYCTVKFVKKPSGSKPGMVIYKHNKTLYVNPKCT